MTAKEFFGIVGMLMITVWGFIILAGVAAIGWDLYRDWSARRRIVRLIDEDDLDRADIEARRYEMARWN